MSDTVLDEFYGGDIYKAVEAVNENTRHYPTSIRSVDLNGWPVECVWCAEAAGVVCPVRNDAPLFGAALCLACFAKCSDSDLGIPEWSYLVEPVAIKGGGLLLPCAAMRHNPSGVVFYMTTPATAHLLPLNRYHRDTKLGRGWNWHRKETQARAEYERLLAAGEILMRCEFCRVEGRAHVRGLCPDCLMLCWVCGEAATVSEIPSDNYRAGETWALAPRTLCGGCLAESELELVAYRESVTTAYGAEGITDDDIPF